MAITTSKRTSDFSIDSDEKLRDGAEFMHVALPSDSNITIRSLLDKTREHMGPRAFTDYNARTNR